MLHGMIGGAVEKDRDRVMHYNRFFEKSFLAHKDLFDESSILEYDRCRQSCVYCVSSFLPPGFEFLRDKFIADARERFRNISGLYPPH